MIWTISISTWDGFISFHKCSQNSDIFSIFWEQNFRASTGPMFTMLVREQFLSKLLLWTNVGQKNKSKISHFSNKKPRLRTNSTFVQKTVISLGEIHPCKRERARSQRPRSRKGHKGRIEFGTSRTFLLSFFLDSSYSITNEKGVRTATHEISGD